MFPIVSGGPTDSAAWSGGTAAARVVYVQWFGLSGPQHVALGQHGHGELDKNAQLNGLILGFIIWFYVWFDMV